MRGVAQLTQTAEGRVAVVLVLGMATALWTKVACNTRTAALVMGITAVVMRLTARGGSAAVLATRAQLEGRVAIVTGANAGIGYATACALLRAGCHVFVMCRTKSKAEETVKSLLRQIPKAKISTLYADMSDLAAVATAADEFLKADLPLHILVNNAGMMVNSLTYTTADKKLELHTATNVLGPMVFTERLATRIVRSSGRIIHVSSAAHQRWRPAAGETLCSALADVNNGASNARGSLAEKGASASFARYGVSKLLNIHYANYVAHTHGIPTCSLHPGIVMSSFGANLLWGWEIAKYALLCFFKTSNEGAQTTIHCCLCDATALKPLALPGEGLMAPYFVDCADRTTTLLKLQGGVKGGNEAIAWCRRVITPYIA